MIFVYKTNITSKGMAKRTEKELNKLLPNADWNFDLEDCDNILRVDSKRDVSRLLKAEMCKIGIEINELPD